MKIENWSVVNTIFDPYKAPELHTPSIHGNVYDNPKFPDGTEIITSRVVNKKGTAIVTKSGSVYELGVVDEQYEKMYPSARERVFSSLKEIE